MRINLSRRTDVENINALLKRSFATSNEFINKLPVDAISTLNGLVGEMLCLGFVYSLAADTVELSVLETAKDNKRIFVYYAKKIIADSALDWEEHYEIIVFDDVNGRITLDSGIYLNSLLELQSDSDLEAEMVEKVLSDEAVFQMQILLEKMHGQDNYAIQPALYAFTDIGMLLTKI